MNPIEIVFDISILLPFAFEIRAVSLAIGITAWFHYHNMGTVAPKKSSMIFASMLGVIEGVSVGMIIGGIFGSYPLIMYSSLVGFVMVVLLWIYLWHNGMHVHTVLNNMPDPQIAEIPGIARDK
jgi:hypothetical protein